MNKIGLTVEEAAEYTGIGRDTLRRLVAWGKLPVLQIGCKSIIRTIDFCDTLAKILSDARKQQILNRLACGELYRKNYYLPVKGEEPHLL